MSNSQNNKAQKKPLSKGNGKQKSRTPPKEKNRQKQQRGSIAAAYSTKQNTLPLKSSILRDGSRSLKWKEFVQDIDGSASFSAESYPVQPGIPTLFAWLSNQALFFQEYEFKNLKFLFETEKGSSTNGKVMFAFMPDGADSLPTSKQEMLENMYKASGAPWEPFSLHVPMQALTGLGKTRYVRTGTLSSNLDIKTYDVGQLIVATQGMADSTAVGELYVEYEIVLKTPLQNNTQLANIFSKRITGVSPSQTSFLGTAPTYLGNLDLIASGNTMTFNRVGSYLVTAHVTGTGLNTTFTPTMSGTASSSVVDGVGNAAGNVGTLGISVILVVVSARGQTAIFDFSSDSATISASLARVAMYSALT